MDPKALALPSVVVGPPDISRLRREIETLNDYMRQAELRKSGEETTKLPRTSRMLEELASLNKLNLLQEADRTRVDAFLDDLMKHAPVVHISFAADPSSAFTAKVVVWLRQNIHPLMLMRIGLQPTIAAGCVVRTPNHYYDFSLRRHFAAKRPVLIDKLESLNNVG